MDLRKIDLRTKAGNAGNSDTNELSEAQLASVVGGKASVSLMKACATGVHIREAKITC